MIQVTATVLARQLRQILDKVEFRGEEIAIVRNNHKIATILPGVSKMTAMEAMSDLYRTLPEDAAKDWIPDSRCIGGKKGRTKSKRTTLQDLRNPWVI